MVYCIWNRIIVITYRLKDSQMCVTKSRVIYKKRYEIFFERIIGLAKKCTILKKELSHDKAMGSRIIFICVSIFNFRHYIVNKYS